MSNNLRQIAKDLRSFVKRCKDVHYSDSLLITFLVTGLLTLAPKTLSADAVQEQQEVSAQAYDTITDLRQSFLRARQENEKSIKGAERELVMLMEQGDQVIKSPWASFQFATGFTNNDWKTSFRGRGGKYLEYYRRNNDLTKYVFDASKHQYGATNLHVQRNQEPNTLEINPANVHEPYRPYVPERLDALVLPTTPEFNPTVYTSDGVTRNYYATVNVTSPNNPEAASNYYKTGSLNSVDERYFNNLTTTYNTNEANASGSNAASSPTNGASFEKSSSTNTVYNGRYWWRGSVNLTTMNTITGGTFNVGNLQDTWTGYSGWWYWGNWGNAWSTYNHASVDGRNIYGADDMTNTYSYSITPSNPTNAIEWARITYLNANPSKTWSDAVAAIPNSVTYHYSGFPAVHDGYNYTENGVTKQALFTSPAVTYSLSAHPVDASIKTSEDLTLRGNSFTINSGDHARNGVIVTGNKTTLTTNGSTGNSFGVSGTGTNGILVTGGTIDSTSTTININGDKINGILFASGHSGSSDVRNGSINVNGGTENNGIYTNGGTVNTNTVTFTVAGPGGTTNNKNIGIFADSSSTKVDDTNSTFTITGTGNNGIYVAGGDVDATGSVFNVNGSWKNNGIFSNSTGDVKVTNGTFGVTSTESNGIRAKNGKVVTTTSTFTVSGSYTNGINLTDSVTNLEDTDSTFTVSGSNSNGVYAKKGDIKLDGTRMTVSGTNNNGVILFNTATPINIQGTNRRGSYTVEDSGGSNGNNGIFVTNGTTVDKIDKTDITVKGNGVGILVGDTTGTGTITTITDTAINVDETDAASDKSGTGIYVYDGVITFGDKSKITGNGNDILMAVNTPSQNGNTITFNKTASLSASGNNNIAINLQNGVTSDTGTTTITGDNVDITFNGNNNSVYKVNGYISKLEIDNGDDVSGSTYGVGKDNLGAPTQTGIGKIYLNGDNNTVYNGSAFVDNTASKIVLGDAQLVGNYNTLVRLNGPSLDVVSNPTKAAVGAFAGKIHIQGAMGGEYAHWQPRNGTTNKYNVALYAGSGQNKAFGKGLISNLNGLLDNVKVEDINVGFGSAAEHSVLIFATNGTGVDVKNTIQPGNSGYAVITDGVKSGGGTVNRGYNTTDIKYSNTSRKTIMGYADGVFSRLTNYATGGGASVPKEQSTINFESDVDMVAKEGIAYYAIDGGKVKVGKAGAANQTRAGGGQSIVAFADGLDQAYVASGISGRSTIDIVGNITAADYMIIGDYENRSNPERALVYQNIGAYAKNGGQISIDESTPATKAAEDDAANIVVTQGGTATASTGQSTKSLVYGMGAFAEGDGSFINIKGDGIHVVTGPNSGVYARDKGAINFAGNITNQNNLVNTSGTPYLLTSDFSTGASNHDVTSATVQRIGIRGQGNDHTNSTPFYVDRRTVDDTTANINFTGDTNIAMYDGILYSGNQYGFHDWHNNIYKPLSDYYKKSDNDNTPGWAAAKYRGMENVTTYISQGKSQDGGVNIGVINQPKEEIKWDNKQAGGDGTDGYLKGIGKDYTGMTIKNKMTTPNDLSHGINDDQWEIYSTVINGRIKVDQDVVIEDVKSTKNTATDVTNITGSKKNNDPFNDIAMESNLVSIEAGKNMFGDASYRDLGPSYARNFQRNNVGFSMGNSLNRWDDLTLNATADNWRKTKNSESGITNKGVVDIWGGSETTPVTGLLVNFGTLKNGDGSAGGVVRVDHGNALVATDGSIIQNLKDSEITVTGKYDPVNKGANVTRTAESKASGENYGIVGISDTREINYNTANNSGIGDDIKLIKVRHEDAKIYVEGDKATGIYVENRNNALASNVEIEYINKASGTTGIDVSNPNLDSSNARGVGIALINKSSTTYPNGAVDAGGVIKLTGASDGDLGTAAMPSGASTLPGSSSLATLGGSNGLTLDLGKNDILTGKNGVGIYAESADIQVLSDKFTVLTKDNGVGLWAMDDTHIAVGADHDKKFQYNYNGANDKNGFAMAFGGKNTGYTTASNYMDIKFSNRGDNNKQLNLQKEATLPATSGTTKGIAGILVNTNDAGDRVINKGHIEEHKSSVTNLRAYGAVVNKGTFENWGDIKLNESLMPAKASDVKTADMKKVNVGIMANDHSANARYNTYIENYGDITIGDVKDGANSVNQDTNIGSWAIYGYNVKTGAKADGTDSTYRINKNSYGIYSGDGNVQIQKGTKIYVGNDTVLGHKQNTQTIDGVTYTIDRQNGNYATDAQLLSGLDTPRERDSSIGVYIDNNRRLSDTARNVEVSADMNIDRFSHGIVLAEKDGGQMTNVTIGSASNSPQIKVAWSTDDNKGKHVHSEKPHEDPKLSKEVEEQGNAVYYYSADNRSHAVTYADVKMDGDYNTAYFTKGSVDNYGTIDLRSQYDVEKRLSDPNHKAVGYGSVGIISENTADPSINRGTITTGLSDTQNMMYSVGMGAGRNYYRTNNKGESVYDRTEGQGYVVNEGTINVQEDAGIGMLATGKGSKAINRGTINLIGDNAIGMYIDREAVGINEATGVIKGNAQNLKGVIAINGGYIKNYGTITVEGSGSKGIVTDSSKFTLDANGNPVAYITDTSSAEYKAGVTAGEANGHGHADLYGGTETSIEEGTSGNPKTTGVGTTITRPDIVPLTTITVDGIPTPIYELENDASRPGQWAETIEVRNSIQTGENGEPIMGIGLWTRDEYGNPAWPRYRNEQLSEVTSVGMYVDTSGVKYTNPINGLDNLPRLGKVNLYFGPEITEYTNSKAIRIGDRIEKDASGNDIIIKSNILKPFNDALRRLPGGATVNALSSSLTWQVSANIDDNNQISELYMSKVPYHSFAYDDDKSLVNFTNNLDNIYEIARRGSEEKMIFNKLNSLGNGEGHILAQAFDQMRGHIYGGIQQRTKSTSDILSNEVAQLRSETNGSKDSNKFKAFGQRNEYKTDTAGIPDWKSNAGGMVYVHEDETVKLGEKSGFYAGVTNNYFTFKDLARSYENQAMAKAGVFKQTPLDENGTFTITVGGEGFFGRTDTKRRFWVVDKEFRAKSNYYTYGAGLNANLEKVFRINQGFSIVPNVGLNFEYGRFSTVNEDGDMALKVKSDDYYSIKPKAGIDFRYSQPVFKNSKFTASLGFSYENELGRLNEVENEARIKGAWTDYYTIKGDKEDRRGNFKSDLKLGLDNGRLGMTVNTGYDTKGHNFRAGLGLKVMY